MQRPVCNLVWFKRDLRLSDHAALEAASESDLPVILCYFWEPSLTKIPESDPRHWRFIYQSLLDLSERLTEKSIRLHVFKMELVDGLELITEYYHIKNIYSHQETGLLFTFERDKVVSKFCKDKGIIWKEFPQDGVIRALKNRDNWAKNWKTHMEGQQCQTDWQRLKSINLPQELSEKLNEEKLIADRQHKESSLQPGGENYAWKYLNSFLNKRVQNYTPHISKPEESRRSGSRISPYIAYGNLSARQVYQLSEYYRSQSSYAKMIGHFQDRVWWRSHYMQKLESDYRIEYEDLNIGFESIPRVERDYFYEAFINGNTGFPMVDASIKCLLATGFMNFRMRAMLSTFWSFTLGQDWKKIASFLARIFLDFEPGIHYAQLQMQAGMSGYHPLRIYNPTEQSRKHDPKGNFVRKWLPSLSQVPAPQIYEPWTMTNMEQSFYRCRIGVDYPAPIVSFDEATRENKESYWAVRQTSAVVYQLPGIWMRHCIPENRKAYAQAILGKMQIEMIEAGQ